MNVQETGIFEAKTHLSAMIDKVQKEGITYRITKRGKPVAEIRPVSQVKPPLKAGYGKGSVLYIAPDFDAPLEDFKDYM
jgi:prevent-host-death family protein